MRIPPLAFVAALVLAGCGATSVLPSAPKTPAQAAYEMSATYAAALTVANAYDALPKCEAPAAPKLCADPAIRAQIKVKVDLADPMITAAQVVARAVNPNASVAANILSTATAAIADLSALTTTLKVQ